MNLKSLFSIALIFYQCLTFAQTEKTPVFTISAKGRNTAMAISPDENYLALGDENGLIRVINLTTGKETLSFIQYLNMFVTSLSYSPDGKYIAAGTSYNKLLIYNSLNGLAVKSFESGPYTWSSSFSPDGNYLAIGGSDNAARIYDFTTGKLIKLFSHSDYVWSVAFSPDGKYLATGSADRYARIIDISSGSERRFQHEGYVKSVAWSYNGKYLATGSYDNRARVYNVNDGKVINTYDFLDFVQSAAFGGRKVVAFGSKDGTALVFDSETGLKTYKFWHNQAVTHTCLSTYGKFLVIGSQSIIKVYSLMDEYQSKYSKLLAQTEQAVSVSDLGVMRDEELKKVLQIEKDEFETQTEFEQRKSQAQIEAKSIRSSYTKRIDEAQKLYNLEKERNRQIFLEKLKESRQAVTSKFSIGVYDPEKGTFSVTLSETNEQFTLSIPREMAREFKAQSPELIANGQRQLNEYIEWEYFNWRISMENGNSFLLGEQKIVQASKIQSGIPKLSTTISFVEPSGNNILDAEEIGRISIAVSNSGDGTALGLVANVTSTNLLGLSYSSSVYIGDVSSGQTRKSELVLYTTDELKNDKNQLTFTFVESRGFQPDPVKVTIETRALAPPKLIISDLGVVEANKNGVIDNGEVVEVTVRLQNVGQGLAKNVSGYFELGQNVFRSIETEATFSVKELKSGEYFDAIIKMYTNNLAKEIPIYITVSESSGKYGIAKQLLDQKKLSLNVRVEQLHEVVIAGKEGPTNNIKLAEGLSVDIEQGLTKTAKLNSNAIAVIIGIKDYANSEIPTVEYAKRDAYWVREYLINVLGYDPKNILPRNPDELMTVGAMKSLLRQRLPAFVKPDGSSEIFIYYSGHGAPSTTTQQPFFVPYDSDPNFVSDDNAYRMVDFYSDVSKIKAKRKIVVIDACFSGQSGDGKTIIKNASPLLLKVTNPLLADKDAIVFQSSDANQVSNWYPEKKHGMFTYFFLKGIKGNADLNNDNYITVGEIEEFVNDENNNLPYLSRREFQRPQRAVVNGNRASILVGK